MNVTVDIAVEDPSWTGIVDLHLITERAVAAALEEAGVVVRDGTELSCLLCDDDAMRALNRQWRGKDKPTNVLSFPAAGPGADRVLGDIVMAFGVVQREAAAENRRIEDHLSHLVVHGVLHLLGEDHEAEAEAQRMEALERRAMRRLGLPDPYEGTGAGEPS